MALMEEGPAFEFRMTAGELSGHGVSFESIERPGHFLRIKNKKLRLEEARSLGMSSHQTVQISRNQDIKKSLGMSCHQTGEENCPHCIASWKLGEAGCEQCVAGLEAWQQSASFELKIPEDLEIAFEGYCIISPIGTTDCLEATGPEGAVVHGSSTGGGVVSDLLYWNLRSGPVPPRKARVVMQRPP